MKHLVCSKCKDYFDLKEKKPYLLPSCGHSLCAKCLLTLINQNSEEIICPEDDEPCDFYDKAKGIESFPVNKAIQKFLLKNKGKNLAQEESSCESEVEDLEHSQTQRD